MTEQQKPILTLEEYCKRVGLPWPMPRPGTPEADKLTDDVMDGKVRPPAPLSP